MTEMETTLLMLIYKGKGNSSWHKLAVSLSMIDVSRELDMMSVLHTLEKQGYIWQEVQSGSPNDRWGLTEKGLQIITSFNLD